MPNGKRASMREGPLAALFRKTAEETAGGSEGPSPRAEKPREEPRRQQAPEAAVEQPPVEQRPARERSPAHPSLARQPQPEPEPHIPTPQGRLRHAVPSAIPE